MDELYNSFGGFLKEKFPGGRVLKIPIDAGFACPNRDGTVSQDGCIFCDRYASGPIHTAGWPIRRQIDFHIRRHPHHRYIAYYQAYCNTHAPVPELAEKYEIVFQYEEIVGLFIGTRPDALPAPVLSLLEKINRRTYLAVELGLQSIHERSLDYLRRNHTYAQFRDAFAGLRERGIATVVHLIIGIPGETRRQMLETVEAMNRLRPDGIKFHLFHVLRDTELHSRHEKSPLPLLTQEQYVDIMAELLENLDPGIVIHRLCADREKEIFVAPSWALNKHGVLEAVRRRMRVRNSFQGKHARLVAARDIPGIPPPARRVDNEGQMV